MHDAEFDRQKISQKNSTTYQSKYIFWFSVNLDTEGNWDPHYLSIVVNISNITPHFENKLRAHGVFARVISANITGDKKWRKHKNQLGSVEREGRSTAEPSRAPHRQPVIWRILEEMRFITYLARPAWLPLSLVIFSVFPYRGGKMLNS